MEKYNMVTILGATASGKTGVAVNLALQTGGEIISADSRQVYRGMDLGTGKDLNEYTVDGVEVPYHLIDIVDAGTEFNVYQFQQHFINAFRQIEQHNRLPILCGGSGMYIEAVLKGYSLINVPPNEALRQQLSGKTLDELAAILLSYKELHNTSDIETKRRAIRAIEIEDYYRTHPKEEDNFPIINSLIVGVYFDRDLRRQRISQRLKQRLDDGMIDEVKRLIENGVAPESLIYYGLEYKFLTLHVLGELSYSEMFCQLEIAIHQFSKRQMTWFRKMERDGFNIHWLDGNLPIEDKLGQIECWMNA
jgi:tRNA dimethylallyltransferase